MRYFSDDKCKQRLYIRNETSRGMRSKAQARCVSIYRKSLLLNSKNRREGREGREGRRGQCIWDVFQTRSSFGRCRVPRSRYLVRFGLLFHFSAVAKWCQHRSNSHPEVQKNVLGSRGGNVVAPMIVLIQFLQVLGTGFSWFRVSILVIFLCFLPKTSYVQSEQREILLTFTADKITYSCGGMLLTLPQDKCNSFNPIWLPLRISQVYLYIYIYIICFHI